MAKARKGSKADLARAESATTLSTPYSGRYEAYADIPKYSLPSDGIAANAAYQLVHDELDFDCKPNLNMASFVHTYVRFFRPFSMTMLTCLRWNPKPTS